MAQSPLAQRAYIWHSTVLSLGLIAQLIMIVLLQTALIGSRCIPNGAHTNHCWANLLHSLKRIKNSDVLVSLLLHAYVYNYMYMYIMYLGCFWNMYTCTCTYFSVFNKLIWPKELIFGTAQFSLWAWSLS